MDISKRIFVNENLFFEGGEEGGCARGGRAAVPSYHCSSSQGERGGEEGGCALPHKKKIHKEDIEEAGSSSPIPSATTEILEGFEHLRITPKRMEILCNRFGPELVNSTALALDAELDSTSVVDHGKKLTNWLNHAQKSSSREQESGTPPYAPRPPRELSAAAAELVADLTERHGSYQPRGPFIFFAKRDAESYLLRLHDENGSAIEASELVVYRKHASLERELKRHLAKLQKDLEILTKGVSDE